MNPDPMREYWDPGWTPEDDEAHRARAEDPGESDLPSPAELHYQEPRPRHRRRRQYGASDPAGSNEATDAVAERLT